jgi:DNA-binding response OmpR family regulator
MIVDDEPDVLNSLKTILEQEKYEVITVENGDECLKQLKEDFQDIILINILIPDMNGWDTIKEIVNRGYIKNVTINIVTGMGVKDHQQMGILDPYIYDYLTKSVNIEELIKSIEKSNIFYGKKIKKERMELSSNPFRRVAFHPFHPFRPQVHLVALVVLHRLLMQ